MRKRSALPFLLLFFLFLSRVWGEGEGQTQWVQTLRVQTQNEIFPGEPLPIRLDSIPGVQQVEVLLWEDATRKNLVTKGNAFRVQSGYDTGQKNHGSSSTIGDSRTGDGSALWVGFLGIPSTTRPGAYQLEIRWGEVSQVLPLTVLNRSFIHEEIALNREMTKLRTEEDIRKIVEMRELLERVSRFEPRSIFHLKAFRLPVMGFRRTSQFGDHRKYRYVDGATDQAIHTGIDFATPRGTPVEAAASGLVVFAGPRILTGNTVVLEHLPGVHSLYYHLDRIDIQEGDLVQEGVRIGNSGATGLVTGPHLHWEVRVGGIPVNPDAFLRMGPLDKFFQLRETAVDSKEGR